MRKPTLLAAATAAFVLASHAAAQCLEDRLLPPSSSDTFGIGLAVRGPWIAATSYHIATGTSEVLLYRQGGDGRWDLSQTLTLPPNPATVAMDGERLFVLSASVLRSYRLEGETWVPFGANTHTLVPTSRLTAGGGLVVASNSTYDLGGFYLIGALRAYRDTPSGTLEVVFGASGPSRSDQRLGASLGANSTMVAAGAPGTSSGFDSVPGYVQIFEMQDGQFAGSYQLADPNGEGQDTLFGEALALGTDYLAVQAAAGAEGLGRVEVFRYEESVLVHDATLVPPAGAEFFGLGLALDGVNLVASYYLPVGGSFEGNVRHAVYQRLLGTWVLRTVLAVPGDEPNVAIAAVDGTRVVTGVPSVAFDVGPGGAIWSWNLPGVICPGNIVSPKQVALASGGTVDVFTSFAPQAAGEIYAVLGSLSGTTPTLSLDGLPIPLVPDAWTSFALSSFNQAPFHATLGTLNGLGLAKSTLTLPAGLPPALAGATLYQATIALDPSVGSATRVSAPSALLLVP